MTTKRDRVYATLKGEIIDRVPTGFWMHFPKENYFGEQAINAHIEYFEKSKTDVCKVMTEHIYPCFHNINSVSDWDKIECYDESADFIRKQADIISSVVKRVKDASIVGTVHGLIASSSHALLGVPKYDGIGSHAIVYHTRMQPETMLKAFEKISDSLCAMIRAQIKSGAEGIYYATLGGESYLFTDEEHKEYIAPFDKKIINAAYDAGAKYVILHLCKPKVKLERFKSYNCDIVNWGIEESGVSLKEGRILFPNKVLLGGFNNQHGPLINGSREEIKQTIVDIINDVGMTNLILGSDCTLPRDLSYERIASVAELSQEISLGILNNGKN